MDDPGSTRPRPPRDPMLDTARAILVALVVIGHVVDPGASRSATALYLWVYSFHMPAFVLISGFLTRSYSGTPRQVRSLVATLLVPYVVFRAIHEVERWFLTGHVSHSLLLPSFALWFLLALFCWRLLTPVLVVLRHPLVVAVVVSVLVPFDTAVSGVFALDRVLGMLPFFVAGLLLTPQAIDRLRVRAVRVGAVAWFAVAAVAAWCLVGHVRRQVLQLADPYRALHLHGLDGPTTRVLVLVVGFVGALSVLALAPRRDGWLATVGRNSLTVYLLQAAVLFPLRSLGVFDDRGGVAATAALAAFGIALALVLGTPPVERWTRWLVRPPVDWLLRPQASVQPSSGR